MSANTTSSARITRLRLTDFRSYHHADIRAGDGPVVLVGPNGAGKTNLLEAISLLAPGRGLRRASLDQFAARGPDGTQASGWAVSAVVEGAYGEVTLGTGLEADAGEARSRRCRIDGEPVGSAAAFADHVRVVWLTPDMDGLFTGPPSERRRFLDRLVLAVDAEHGARVQCAGAGAALAQPAAGGRRDRPALSRRGRARTRRPRHRRRRRPAGDRAPPRRQHRAKP